MRGVSGMLVGAPLAYELGKPIVIVRKSDGSHSGHSVEGPTCVGRYAIIDDLVDSGDTLREIVAKVKEHDADARCVSVMLYAHWVSIQWEPDAARARAKVTDALRTPDMHAVIMHAGSMARITTAKLEMKARRRRQDRERAEGL